MYIDMYMCKWRRALSSFQTNTPTPTPTPTPTIHVERDTARSTKRNTPNQGLKSFDLFQ